MNESDRKVPKRIAQAVLHSLKGGVVPRIGLPYITVGRKSEIQALLHDVDIISEAARRSGLLSGDTVQEELSAAGYQELHDGSRFHCCGCRLIAGAPPAGTRGQGLATYRELIGNLSTKTKPEGGALPLVLERWISTVQTEALTESGLQPGDPALTALVDQKYMP